MFTLPSSSSTQPIRYRSPHLYHSLLLAKFTVKVRVMSLISFILAVPRRGSVLFSSQPIPAPNPPCQVTTLILGLWFFFQPTPLYFSLPDPIFSHTPSPIKLPRSHPQPVSHSSATFIFFLPTSSFSSHLNFHQPTLRDR